MLERLPAFLAAVLVGSHDSRASLSGHLRRGLRPSYLGSSSYRRMRRRAGSGSVVSARADAQRKRGRGLIIRRLANRNDVVLAKRPIHVLDSNATLFGHLLEGLCPADRFFDVADALIRET